MEDLAIADRAELGGVLSSGSRGVAGRGPCGSRDDCVLSRRGRELQERPPARRRDPSSAGSRRQVGEAARLRVRGQPLILVPSSISLVASAWPAW